MQRRIPGNWDGGMSGGHPEGRNPPDPRNDPRQNRSPLSAFLPGQRALLAEQLAAGFGGSPQGFAQQLQAMYKPTFQPAPYRAGGGGFQNGGKFQPPREAVQNASIVTGNPYWWM